MTYIAPLRKVRPTEVMVRKDGVVAPPGYERIPPRNWPDEYRACNENLPNYVPVPPAILTWTAPSGDVCWWDQNGFFVRPRGGNKGHGYIVTRISPRKIAAAVGRQAMRKVHKRRSAWLKRRRRALVK